MLRASRILATSGGTTTSRAALMRTSRAATTTARRIGATERVAPSARWRATLDAVARTARAQAEQRRDVRALAPALHPRLGHRCCRHAPATITPRPPANCEVTVAVPQRRPRRRVARFSEVVAPRRARRALGAARRLLRFYEKVVVAPRPLRDRGLRPDGGQARAVVGDAARRLPRGLVRGPRPPSSSPWGGGWPMIQQSAPWRSRRWRGGRSNKTRKTHRARRCDLRRTAARARTRREALRTLADAPAVIRSSARRSARAASRRPAVRALGLHGFMAMDIASAVKRDFGGPPSTRLRHRRVSPPARSTTRTRRGPRGGPRSSSCTHDAGRDDIRAGAGSRGRLPR